jgi:hypothetical protein
MIAIRNCLSVLPANKVDFGKMASDAAAIADLDMNSFLFIAVGLNERRENLVKDN